MRRGWMAIEPTLPTTCVVAAAVIEALDRLDLDYPKVAPAKQKELLAAKAALLKK